MRMRGTPMSLMSGLASALERLPALFLWVLIDSIVGMLFNLLENTHSLIRDVIYFLLNAMWNVLTLFCVPLILFEGKGAFSSISGSASCYKRIWEGRKKRKTRFFSYFLLLFLAVLVTPSLVFLIVYHMHLLTFLKAHPFLVLLLLFLFFVIISVVSNVFEAVVVSSLYLYARDPDSKEPPLLFTRQQLDCV